MAKLLKLLSACLPLLATAACGEPMQAAAQAQCPALAAADGQGFAPPGYRLAFADEFDRLDLDNGVAEAPDGTWLTYWRGWGVRHLEGNRDQAMKADASYAGRGGPTLGEHGVVLHEVSAEGTLKLYGRPTPEPLRAQFHDMPYLGGMISSERSFARRFGYWETRVRLNQVSTGHHWAIWLLSDRHNWPPEIDLLEVVGSNPENQRDAHRLFFNYVSPAEHASGSGQMLGVEPPAGLAAWYSIGFLWTRDDMCWYLDGQPVRHTANFVTEDQLYFLITPEIGGKWTGPPDAGTAWPAELEVDYVRAYRPDT